MITPIIPCILPLFLVYRLHICYCSQLAIYIYIFTLWNTYSAYYMANKFHIINHLHCVFGEWHVTGSEELDIS